MSAVAQSLAEDAGYMYVTDAALAHRLAGDFEGIFRAHYQLGASRGQGVDVYWVEKLKAKKPSWHTVYIMNHDGLLWAECDCKWFIEHRRHSTVCVHILTAVLTHRERN